MFSCRETESEGEKGILWFENDILFENDLKMMFCLKTVWKWFENGCLVLNWGLYYKRLENVILVEKELKMTFEYKKFGKIL